MLAVDEQIPRRPKLQTLPPRPFHEVVNGVTDAMYVLCKPLRVGCAGVCDPEQPRARARQDAPVQPGQGDAGLPLRRSPLRGGRPERSPELSVPRHDRRLGAGLGSSSSGSSRCSGRTFGFSAREARQLAGLEVDTVLAAVREYYDLDADGRGAVMTGTSAGAGGVALSPAHDRAATGVDHRLGPARAPTVCRVWCDGLKGG